MPPRQSIDWTEVPPGGGYPKDTGAPGNRTRRLRSTGKEKRDSLLHPAISFLWSPTRIIGIGYSETIWDIDHGRVDGVDTRAVAYNISRPSLFFEVLPRSIIWVVAPKFRRLSCDREDRSDC